MMNLRHHPGGSARWRGSVLAVLCVWLLVPADAKGEGLDYGLKIDRWEDCPEVWWEGPLFQNGPNDLGPEFHLPQGLVARFTLRLNIPENRELAYHIQEATGWFTCDRIDGALRSEPRIQIAASGESQAGFAPRGNGSVEEAVRRITVTFLIHVPQDAALGPYRFELSLTPAAENALPLKWRASGIHVVRPKVFIVDIDGMRQNLFYGMMAGSNPPEHLADLFGTASRQTVPIDVTRGGRKAETLRFRHGYMVCQATSTFPTYTFAAQAPIVTGALPKETGFPGNEWLDRSPAEGGSVRRYAFTGGNMEPGLGTRLSLADTIASYSTQGLANSMLRAPTVYDTLDEQGIQSLIGFHMYEGSNANGNTFRIPAYLHEQRKYALAASFVESRHWLSAHEYDSEMVDEVLQALGCRADPIGTSTYPGLDFAELGVIFLYFAHLDHSSHQHLYGNVFSTQQKCLHDVDAQLGTFIEGLRRRYGRMVLEHALWIVTADHGQTDCENVVQPDLRDKVLPQWYDVEGTLMQRSIRGPDPVRFTMRRAFESNCSVGYNGGSAHVYLRARHGEWNLLPTDDQIIEAADRIRQLWLKPDVPARDGQPAQYGYSGKLDLILVRLSGDRSVFLPGQVPPYSVYDRAGKVMTLKDYLRSSDCVFYSDRYGWKKQDIDLIEEAITGMNCDRSGDLVLFPTYPQYELEVSHNVGQHGSLVSTDMLVPLATAIPGIDTARSNPTADRILRLLSHSIDLQRKSRPGNRDVPDLILNFHKQQCTVELKPVAMGLPTIETRRSRTHPLHVTEILVKAPILDKLRTGDDGTYGSATFELWGSRSPDGPFEPIRGSDGASFCYVSPDTPIDPNARVGRISQDAVLLSFQAPPSEVPLNHKPFYFKVVQKLYKPDSRLVVSEVSSNVGEPGQLGLRLLYGNSKKVADAVELDGIPSKWVQMRAAVGYDNQAFDLWGAHLTVQSEGWTGHFWSPRLETHVDNNSQIHTQAFGSSLSWQNAETEIRFPFRLAGQTVQIQAEMEDPNAGGPMTRSIRVQGPPDKVAAELREAEEDEAQRKTYMERDIQNFQQSKTEDWPGRIAEIRKENEYLARRRDSLSFARKASNDIDMIGYNWWLQEDHDSSIAASRLFDQAFSGRDRGDWRNVIDSLLRQLARVEPDLQRNLRYFQERKAISVPAAPGRGEKPEVAAKWFDDAMEKARKDAEKRRSEIITEIAQSAPLAGDAQSLKGATQELMRLARAHDGERGTSTDMSSWWWEYASNWVMLTGQRDEAAGIWLIGWEARRQALGIRSQTTQDGTEASYLSAASLNTWWPVHWTPDDAASVPSTADLEASVRAWEDQIRSAYGSTGAAPRAMTDRGAGTATSDPTVPSPAGRRREAAADGASSARPPAGQPSVATPPAQTTTEPAVILPPVSAEDAAAAKSCNEQGRRLWRQAAFAEAEAQWRKAAQLDPTNPEHLHNLAVALGTKNQYVEAEKLWRRALTLAPANAKYTAHYGLALQKTGRPAEAEAAIRRAIQLDPKYGSAHNQLGIFLLEGKRWPEAEKTFRNAVEAEPGNGAYHANLAQALLEQGKRQEAVQEAQTARSLGLSEHAVYARLSLDSQPTSPTQPIQTQPSVTGPEPDMNQFAALLWSNNLDAALTEIRRLSGQYPDHPMVGVARIGLEVIFKNMKDAKTLADRLYGLYPQQATVLIARGQVALSSNDATTAQQMFNLALQANPQVAGHYYSQGIQLFDRKCYKLAYQQFATVAAMSPQQMWMSRYYLGVAAEWLGDPKDAVAQYEAFLRQNPPADWANAARASLQRLRALRP